MTFNLNSELYAASSLAEGVDYARRHRRHERFDDTQARTDDVPKTTILAPHGGGIEPGTSELCLAVAGYHPASLPQIPAAGVTYDYWMFEGLRDSGNPELHVTSTGCDDGVAVSLCAGSLNAVALHGFLPRPPMSGNDQGAAILVMFVHGLAENVIQGLKFTLQAAAILDIEGRVLCRRENVTGHNDVSLPEMDDAVAVGNCVRHVKHVDAFLVEELSPSTR